MRWWNYDWKSKRSFNLWSLLFKENKFDFFPNDNDRIAIVYGKNGSGKSTISYGFSQIASGEDTEELSASLIDRADNEIDLVPESKIFVFNEKYIDENVKIDADGLGTIILLGGQVDLQARYRSLYGVVGDSSRRTWCTSNSIAIIWK